MMMGSFVETQSGSKPMSDERKAHWYFHPWFLELMALFWLDIAGTDPADFGLYNKIVQDYHLFLDKNPRPPVQLLTGDEVMDILGLAPGERVGEIPSHSMLRKSEGRSLRKRSDRISQKSQKPVTEPHPLRRTHTTE